MSALNIILGLSSGVIGFFLWLILPCIGISLASKKNNDWFMLLCLPSECIVALAVISFGIEAFSNKEIVVNILAYFILFVAVGGTSAIWISTLRDKNNTKFIKRNVMI